MKYLLIQKVLTAIEREHQEGYSSILYFHIGLGKNIDHQLLTKVAFIIQQKGYQVFYYEEWPYVEDYELSKKNNNGLWYPSIYPIDLRVKINTSLCYTSQIYRIGNSPKSFVRRLLKYTYSINGSYPAERIWGLLGEYTGIEEKINIPLIPKQQIWRIRDFSKFVKTLYWRDLKNVLPVGRGICLDIGCGKGRHRWVIEKAGYQWIGLDISNLKASIIGDAQHLPIISEKVACVVLWQVLEYTDNPEQVFAESFRVLESGGVICGSISFLEPLHGQSLYSISPLLLEKLLSKYGFADVQILPGILSFVLIFWTWLKRWGGKDLARLAFLLTALWLIPFAFLRYLVSWFWWRLGYGSGFGMLWITDKMLLEFAGHILFVARKSC